MKRRWDALLIVVVFVLLAGLNFTSLTAANRAQKEAERVRTTLEAINVEAQNRCIVKVVLSYPPPIGEDQFDVVLADYDTCIRDETGGGS